MKALSIRQPWAWAICACHKDVENRTWRTDFRGRFLVHAGRRYDAEGAAWIAQNIGLKIPRDLPRGAVIGEADLVGCVRDSSSAWAFPGMYHFELANARLHDRPVPQPGQLRFFEVSQSLHSGRSSEGTMRKPKSPRSAEEEGLLPSNTYFQELTLKALRALGGTAERHTIRRKAIELGEFSAAQLAVPSPPKNKGNFQNRIGFELSFALTHLKAAGKITNVQRGIWTLLEDQNHRASR